MYRSETEGEMGMRKKMKFLIVAALMIMSLTACSGEPSPIPNVMGINYNDAKTVLEDAGFKVTAIEADASSILPNTAWDRSVKKGEVFKVNDETYPEYTNDAMNPATDSETTIIYYAIEDYIFVEPVESKEEVSDIPEVEIPDTSSSMLEETPSIVEMPTNTEWKEWLEEYEAWVDNYIELSEKYAENPTDTTLMTEYLEALTEMVEWSEKADEVEMDLEDDPDALTEYLETLSRISQKLSQIDN